jgi:phospholipid/cholesterol/gamma-HCH transport system substrate-binding protein
LTPRFTFIERTVGLFILVAFLSFLGTVILVGRAQNWFRKHNDYYAIYNQGYNIQPGVKVKLLRTDIGQVTGVNLTEFNKVRVDMRILATYADRIRTDSQAAVESPTFIGSEFINIVPSANPEAENIEPGGQIPAVEKKELKDYVVEFELEHKLLLVEEVLENVADITESMAQPRGPLLGTLENIRRLTAKIDEGEGSLGKFVSRDEVYDQLKRELDILEGIVVNIKEASESIRVGAKSVQQGAASVQRGAKSTEEIAADLEKDIPIILTKVQAVLDELDIAVQDIPEIGRETRRGLRDVNRILESIKKNILIRGNLPKRPAPETHGIQIQGD